MPRKTNKHRNRGNKTRKQKTLVMIGCSKKGKKSCLNKKVFSTLANKSCPNCHCGPNCKCTHFFPETCYLNLRNKKLRGGSTGCGSCGCPIAPMSAEQMNKFGGGYGSYTGVLNQPVMNNYSNGGYGSYPGVLNQPVMNNYSNGDYGSILGIGQNGGTCGACGQIPVAAQSGGNFYKPPGPIPGPDVGKPWGGDLKWPTMNGIGSDRNYLASYGGVITNDPQQQMSMNDAGYLTKNSMVGGYRYNKKYHSNSSSRGYRYNKKSHSSSNSSSNSSSKTGGALVPQDLGRDFSYNFKTAYNALNGYKAPVNPAPYKDQLTGSLNNRFML